MTTHVFHGPTITSEEVRRHLRHAVLHPPIRHGDLPRLRPRLGDTVVIIDGVFHQQAAVRHKEILTVLDQGCRVLGASSMGALRAAELDVFGMTGVGDVYTMYKNGVTESDADVAVTHTPEGVALSVALVDVIALTTQASHEGAITAEEAGSIVEWMRQTHYSARSWRALESQSGIHTDAVDRFGAWRDADPSRRGAKYDDAVAALRQVAAGAWPVAPQWRWRDLPWRNEFVAEWALTHSACEKHAAIPFQAELEHARIHDPAMPDRWRRHVLGVIAGQPAGHGLPEDELEDRALAVAAADGIDAERLSARQRRYWLTAAEVEALPPREALSRILVRATWIDPASPWMPRDHGGDYGLLSAEYDVAEAVAEAHSVNERAARGGVRWENLDQDAVVEYLSLLWQVGSTSEPEMTAAARDRGFRHLDGAARTCRQFILAAMGEQLWTTLDAA